MTRIFSTLAFLSLGLFAASIVLGLWIGNLYDMSDQEAFESAFQARGVHLLTGTATALAVVLVHSIVVTYFVGTSRWCKEVTETYGLDPEPLTRSTQLKRQTFPWCVTGMLTVVGVGALGAASDPGTGRAGTEAMADYHLAAAFLGMTLVAWTYFRAWTNIVANQEVIETIVDMVAQIRRERGLDTESTDSDEPVGMASSAHS